ncbi:hypothetical protein MTR67_031953 [Solanum verrucosum]|uniref:Uncharacterized protein n=1 Tax=Solanum verrucosum TaxID=315347 RepID=A0AAF0ZH46_SOLVR|nr:hypothetical protein MTR67_031953 [Solanum verrucosum]
MAQIEKKLADGKRIKFRKDAWKEQSPLMEIFPDLFILSNNPDGTIYDMWSAQGWNLFFRRLLNDWEIDRVADLLNRIDDFNGTTAEPDTLRWKHNIDGQFSVKRVYKMEERVQCRGQPKIWRNLWNSPSPTKEAAKVKRSGGGSSHNASGGQFGEREMGGSHAHSRSTLEVPIFWFIHSDPLLVDKHYQAKALSDMVIVVQSEEPSWESHLQCNGRSLLWDLRKPIKAALTAVSEHLAGMLPLHLVYSQAHETAIEDWIWSVGCNPLSITSQGWHISKFHSDTVARSYVLTALEESIQLVNSAIHRLVMERTSEQTFKLFKTHERELVNKYNYVVSLWRRISTVSGELRYLDALRLLYTLEDASKGFVNYVDTTLASLHPIHCTRKREVKVEFDMTTIPAFLVVFFVLWFVLKPRRAKPKIN